MGYYNMNCRIKVGKTLFNICNKIEIKQSIKDTSYTAKIFLPREFGEAKGKNILELIEVGNKVVIELGYDGEYKKEFEGYVVRIGADRPLVLECENECFNLKKERYNKTFKEVKLSEVLNFLDIEHTIYGEDKNLGKYIIENANAYDVLRSLGEQHLLYSFFRGETLIISPLAKYLQQVNNITYKIGVNTRKSSLNYIKVKDKKIYVKLSSTQKDGTVISSFKEKTDGIDEVRIESQRPSNYTKSMLDKDVEDIFNNKNMDGFEGSISAFGIPYIEVGDHCKLIDEQDESKNGTYMVEGVDIYFGRNGFVRNISIGIKIS